MPRSTTGRDKVRNLARRSAAAAKEIKALIEDSVLKVQGGAELVGKSGQTLAEIVASVKRVSDFIADIAAASHEQAAGIDQVNRAVTRMDRVLQGNATQTDALSATAGELSGLASELETLVGRFTTSEEPVPAAMQGQADAARRRRTEPRPRRERTSADHRYTQRHAGSAS